MELHKHFQMMVRGVPTAQEEKGIRGGGGQASSQKPGELEMHAQGTLRGSRWWRLLTAVLGHGHLA